MPLTTEKLKHEAHNLALQHDALWKKRNMNVLRQTVDADLERIQLYTQKLYHDQSFCSQAAEDWLVDHAEFIRGEGINLVNELLARHIRRLPVLKQNGKLRIEAVIEEYLTHTDGLLEDHSFHTYMESYQEVTVLSLAEIWALPSIFRMVIVKRLADVTRRLEERRNICSKVTDLLSTIRPSELSPEKLQQALADHGYELPLSGALTVHLIQHLREHAQDSANVGEWLLCKLENNAESLDELVTYDYEQQAELGVTTGNLVDSLRKLSRWNWQDVLEGLSMVDHVLRGEKSGIYPLMDYASRDQLRAEVERIARRLHVPEKLVATQAVELANRAWNRAQEKQSQELMPRQVNVAYYLLEPEGRHLLRRALKQCAKPGVMPENGIWRRVAGAYFQTITLCFAAWMLLGALWIGWNRDIPFWEGVIVLLVLLLPASEWAVTIVHWLIERVKRPLRLLRYDFSQGVPSEAATMVVIPVIWSKVDDVYSVMDRLELHYLANRDSNIQFAVLGDYKDAEKASIEEDQLILKAAESEIKRLNSTYSETVFYLFQRQRRWNSVDSKWMGWERKRGKLVEFVEWLKGKKDTSFTTVVGDVTRLLNFRYIITLDADTHLPLESARRMIATMHLPYNRARINEKRTRVVEGYGILQPRIGITQEGASTSRLASLWASNPGVDPYAFAVSDPYQDGFGQGIFTGKGIFDIEMFHDILCERIPENRVLSHDLLEGGFLRAGLITDIELVDDHPSTFRSFQKRLHRWVRGDWQLLLWLRRKAFNRRGELQPVDLSVLTRWQILDNMRRSLLQPMLMLTLLLAVSVLPGSPLRWITLVLLTLGLPLWRQLVTPNVWYNPRSLIKTFGHVMVTLMTLPYQAAWLTDAIIRSLYRLTISKRKMLEWISQAEVEQSSKQIGTPVIYGRIFGTLLTFGVIFGAWTNPQPVVLFLGTVLGVIWLVAPLCITWLDQPEKQQDTILTDSEQETLTSLSRDIWHFYEDVVTEEEHWLPPDNLQIDPSVGIAHRTSPTNIGLYLCCVIAARDFSFIDSEGMIERIERTVTTIEDMEKWNGHLYNWYDTTTLKPLSPQYVSTVDSGNFVACLIAVKEGIAEWIQSESYSTKPMKSVTTEKVEAEAFEVAFAEELTAGNTQISHGIERENVENEEMFIQASKATGGSWMQRGRQLLERIDALIQNTDFRPLYDHKAKLLALGYHAGHKERDQVLYDLLASEARQASFVAIALGQVSVSHWHALGRGMVKIDGKVVPLSWTGTMFEYLMPALLMRTYPNTIWSSAYKAVVDKQIAYARQRGVPFGISESGYYAFDHQMNYQYQAFGVPGLGFKRGLEKDLVVAPYATIMALPYEPREALKALKSMEDLGGRGQYGFYEAIDFTSQRLPDRAGHKVIKSYMAHHQGMSMLTLGNVLLKRTMIDRFHRSKLVQAAQLLLMERMPVRPAIIRHPALQRAYEPDSTRTSSYGGIRELHSPHTTLPEVCVLSNGKFTTVVTGSGSGKLMYDGIAVTRWREDPVRDPWGSYVYIRDVDEDQIWSPSFMPCQVEARDQSISFELERAVFSRTDGDIETNLEICVPSGWQAEVRKITLTNKGTKPKWVEVTTYAELSLANPMADDAHPAFSKLFVRTAYEPSAGCLIASRRARETHDRVLWAAHGLFCGEHNEGTTEFETDRSAFVGRGYTLTEPKSIRSRLQGKAGSVADPVFVMRRRVQIAPDGGKVHLFAITAAGDSKDDVLEVIEQLSHEHNVERSFQLAWNRSKIELRHLGMTHEDAVTFQRLAGQLLYTPPLSNVRARYIEGNSLGQSMLWSHGISGDRPIVLVRIEKRSHLGFVNQLLTGHEYLRRMGIFFDLVILNASTDGYYKELQDTLQQAADHGVDRFGADRSGVHVLSEGQLRDEWIALLYAVSRLTLDAGGASLKAQLNQHRSSNVPRLNGNDQAERLAKGHESLQANGDAQSQSTRTSAASMDWHPEHWLHFNGWGGFAPDGKSYNMIVERHHPLPAPWINVVSSRTFGFTISELGTGYTWWRNSRECKLTPWSNDPVLDVPGEIGLLRDEQSGNVWSLTPGTTAAPAPYQVTHGRGFSRFEHYRNGIRHTVTMYVPLEDPVKIIRVSLHNDSEQERKLSVTYYAEWVLGVNRAATAPFIVTKWNGKERVILATNRYQEHFREATAFLGIYPQTSDSSVVASDETLTTTEGLSWTGDRASFIGRNGSVEQPAELRLPQLSRRTGVLYEPCGAVRQAITLQPGESREVIVLLGCTDSEQDALRLARMYKHGKTCATAFDEVEQFWEHELEQIHVQTPSKEMNLLLNGWLLYQAIACRMWARTAFYQAGGAFGFRDQLQDSLAVLHGDPAMTREQILIHAAHQYEEGDVQHWWHEETERGIRTLFTDDLLWLPYVVSRYVEHTGDETILREVRPYLTSEVLKDGEVERYEETVYSDHSGTIYEHCIRAIDKALSRLGEHGIPLIGVGDWNDGMNLVGAEGRGESVWLGWFLCEVLHRFETICNHQGDHKRSEQYRMARQRMAEALNEHGWDGMWYRRAFTDAGNWLGTRENEECRIDAIAQSWSVISGAAPQARALQAMQAFDRELVDRDLKVVRLLTPAFDRTEPSPGYIQGYPPGIRENGAQYTHGVIWSIMAWSKLKDGDKAFELFDMLNPINHTRTDQEVRQYVGEPYVMAADVYTAEPHLGHAGWTWYTGASGWMYQVGVEWILGIRRKGRNLLLDPCIPASWPGFSVTYRYGEKNTRYEIQVTRVASGCQDSRKQLELDGTSIPLQDGQAMIELHDDGAKHNVCLHI